LVRQGHHRLHKKKMIPAKKRRKAIQKTSPPPAEKGRGGETHCAGKRSVFACLKRQQWSRTKRAKRKIRTPDEEVRPVAAIKRNDETMEIPFRGRKRKKGDSAARGTKRKKRTRKKRNGPPSASQLQENRPGRPSTKNTKHYKEKKRVF